MNNLSNESKELYLSKICIYNWTTIKKVKCLISVKLYGVFSSNLAILESAPKIQFHKNKKNDSKWVVIGFMRDYN